MELIWTFLFYSAAGFGLEVAYAHLVSKKAGGRKCLLFLPLCPVYGAGMTAILSLPEAILSRPALLLLAGGLICTGVEYLFALYYERVWHVSFWDYSALPFQLRGRVCLSFGLVWGLLIALVVPLVAEPVAELGRMVPPALLAGLFAAFWADWISTGYVLRRSRDTASLRWWQKGTAFP